jgi:hypothetical protein
VRTYEDERTQGKGRPTPKRRESETHRRQRAAAPRDRKEAVRQTRERARAERARGREALMSGDERYLPKRDRGPVRRFTRDFVDSRRSAGELFFPVAILVLLLSFMRNPAISQIGTFAWLVMIILIVTDSTVLATRLRSQLRRRFPDESRQGTTPYALLRSMQFRRWRMPKPRVKAGTRL